ncbi:MAG: hypothetical protein HYR96_01525 [Deltaproteobacteria bacterium]|nr:hypothetical protein [Deltaproteobacteria bacterium]MBI3293511.1 hypothetical protein [Deltaproteobacteria bacterium]
MIRGEPLFSIRMLKVCVGLAGLLYLINFGLLGFLLGPFDYDHISGYYEIAWRYWRYGSGLPHFNPFLCGGRPLAGDPQLPLFHPIIVLVPLLGAVWTVKIELLFQLSLGLWGLNGILKSLGCLAEERWWAAFCYLCGGAIVARFLVGHVAIGYSLFTPAILYIAHRLDDKPLGPGLILSYWLLYWYGFLGKPNFAIMAVPALFIESTARSFTKRSPVPLAHALLACAVGTLLNLPSALPALDYFALYPRLNDGIPNAIPLHTFFLSLLLPLKTLPEKLYGPHYFGRHEYALFLGAVPAVLAAIGLRRNWREPHLMALLIWALASVTIGLGTDSAANYLRPYTWFYSYWPGFQSVRAPMRLWYAAFLAVIVFSALAFRTRWPGSRRFWLIITAVPLLLNAAINLSKTTILARKTQWAGESRYTDQFTLTSGAASNYFPIRRGEGTRHCFFNIVIPQAPLAEGPMLPEIPGVTLRWLGWNQIRVEWDRPPPKLALNLNHATYWRFEGSGATVSSKDGEPLTLTFSQGPVHGSLLYELPRLKLALFVALATVAASAMVLIGLMVYTRGHDVPSHRTHR